MTKNYSVQNYQGLVCWGKWQFELWPSHERSFLITFDHCPNTIYPQCPLSTVLKKNCISSWLSGLKIGVVTVVATVTTVMRVWSLAQELLCASSVAKKKINNFNFDILFNLIINYKHILKTFPGSLFFLPSFVNNIIYWILVREYVLYSFYILNFMESIFMK